MHVDTTARVSPSPMLNRWNYQWHSKAFSVCATPASRVIFVNRTLMTARQIPVKMQEPALIRRVTISASVHRASKGSVVKLVRRELIIYIYMYRTLVT